MRAFGLVGIGFLLGAGVTLAALFCGVMQTAVVAEAELAGQERATTVEPVKVANEEYNEVVAPITPELPVEQAEVTMPEETKPLRLARFEKENPIGFANYLEVQARREEAVATMLAQRQAFLETVDTALLTPEQQVFHQAYVEALLARDRIFAEVAALRDAGEPIPDELLREKRAAARVLQERYREERNLLLEAAGRSLGLDSEMSVQFAELIGTIYSVTDYQYATQENIRQWMK